MFFYHFEGWRNLLHFALVWDWTLNAKCYNVIRFCIAICVFITFCGVTTRRFQRLQNMQLRATLWYKDAPYITVHFYRITELLMSLWEFFIEFYCYGGISLNDFFPKFTLQILGTWQIAKNYRWLHPEYQVTQTVPHAYVYKFLLLF